MGAPESSGVPESSSVPVSTTSLISVDALLPVSTLVSVDAFLPLGALVSISVSGRAFLHGCASEHGLLFYFKKFEGPGKVKYIKRYLEEKFEG